ncbi:transposase [Botryobacter ruber]|uniref:transposase n=1 Tax=Botryobacter ruber TaxID=2171629 RepID=UPI0013E36F94|nr:transposase [Botryobacter ruber]
MPKLSKRKREFFIHLMSLLVSLRGRFNFTNLSRWGLFNELTYRQHFSKTFDFLAFNSALVMAHCSAELAITFDPSYLFKSGRHTYGLGRFWSGCAQQVRKGLELAGFSCVDLHQWTAMHLYARQTVPQQGQSLMDFYIALLREISGQLLKISKVLCVDAYFSKHDYVVAALECGFTVVSRLRNDAVLYYLYTREKTGKRGRPKVYDGKVDKNAPRAEVFEQFKTEQGAVAYHGLVYIKSLKMKARVVILPQENGKGGWKTPKIFFSTDIEMDGAQVLRGYRSRFQCEFLYRDAKQHTGLTQAQCRSKEKLHYHLNAALTAVSLAKAAHYLNQEDQQRSAFSMADVKMQYSNELLLERFISTFEIDPEQDDNSQKMRKLYNMGRIAA